MFDGPYEYDVTLQWRGDMAAHLLFIGRRKVQGDRARELMMPEWVEVPRHGLLPEDTKPILIEPYDNLLQQLVDAAWAAGVRPTAARDTESVIKAKDDNLRDLRNLIFNQDTTIKGVGRT